MRAPSAVLFVFALALAPALAAAQSSPTSRRDAAPAELPRATVSTTYPTGGRTVRVAADADLQDALDAAKPGDVLLLARSATYVGNFRLKDKGDLPAGARAGGWIVIRTDVPDASLGAPGTRMTPSRAAALRLARIVTADYDPAIGTDPAAHHWRLTGVEIGAADGAPPINMLVRFGDGSARQRTLASVPHHLVVDRSYVHGAPALDLKRCVVLNSATSAVIDSWLADCHSNRGDSQAILGYNGPGPFKIENDHLEAGHEIVAFGGGDPGIKGLVPSDIEIRGNHITRPLAWKKRWQVKNLVETKNVRRLLIEGNVLENNWKDGQTGFAFVLKAENQSNTAPWTTASDITVRLNHLRNTGSAFNLSGHGSNADPVVPATRFTITQNLVEGVNVGPYAGQGIAFQILSGLSDLIIAHNTIINQRTEGAGIVFDGAPAQRVTMHSNVFGGGRYGIKGAGASAGRATLARYAPGALFDRNVVVEGECGLYPSGTACPERMTSVGFVNALEGDFRAGSGPLKGRGLDGGDIGADIARVRAATRGAVVAP
ncbi:MAG TPA: hypothetical protein VFP90_14675 [Gemmatimonadaceae bacterium]|nr:hypothetical protein [Gemmatimonadaceae bacterium]